MPDRTPGIHTPELTWSCCSLWLSQPGDLFPSFLTRVRLRSAFHDNLSLQQRTVHCTLGREGSLRPFHALRSNPAFRGKALISKPPTVGTQHCSKNSGEQCKGIKRLNFSPQVKVCIAYSLPHFESLTSSGKLKSCPNKVRLLKKDLHCVGLVLLPPHSCPLNISSCSEYLEPVSCGMDDRGDTQPNRPLGSGSGFPNGIPVFTIDVGCQILIVFYKNITWSSPLGKQGVTRVRCFI